MDVKVIVLASAVPEAHPTNSPVNVPRRVSGKSDEDIPSVKSANNRATSVAVIASLASNVKPATVTASPAFISLNVNTTLSSSPTMLSAVSTAILANARAVEISVTSALVDAVKASVAPDDVAEPVAQFANAPVVKLPASVLLAAFAIVVA